MTNTPSGQLPLSFSPILDLHPAGRDHYAVTIDGVRAGVVYVLDGIVYVQDGVRTHARAGVTPRAAALSVFLP